MSAPPIALPAYDDPRHFAPLLFGQTVETQTTVDELVGRSRDVVSAAYQLQGSTHVATRDLLPELVRSMNSQSRARCHRRSALRRKPNDAQHWLA